MKWAGALLKHRKTVLCGTLLALTVCLILMRTVSVNYSLSDYLPEDAPSTRALSELGTSQALPALNVFAPVSSVPELLAVKARVQAVDGVSYVMALDDVIDTAVPLPMQDEDTVARWYCAQGALLMAAVEDGADTVRVTREVRKAAGEGALLSGDVYNMAMVQSQNMDEISGILLYVVPLVLLVLLLTTGSWAEPVLFLIVIGVAIALNEGTNAFLGEVSFVTQATGAVLQLAVSMDYAIFLLHRFSERREAGEDTHTAMCRAMTEAFPAILSSALTTVFGFLSLALMRFQIGGDMGVVLAKGVMLSFFTVMITLPVLVLLSEKWLKKTRHKPLIPPMNGLARGIVRVCVPLAAVILIALAPAYMAQSRNTFIYGSAGMNGENSEVSAQARRIQELFGSDQQLLLSVPQGQPARERALHEALLAMPSITQVTSYAGVVGVEVPSAVLTDDSLSQLVSDARTRFILYANVPAEGEDAFAAVQSVRDAAGALYDGDYQLLGECVVNDDLRTIITADATRVQWAAIIAVGLVLLFTFRNALLPFLLLLTIEGAIFLNMSLPYFMGASMNYIGYQIISAVQLGATVDYGILLAQRYMEFRARTDRCGAARMAIAHTAKSILSPVLILIIAGTILAMVSTNGVISQMGAILARGAAISCGMVLLFLPALLITCDSLVMKARIAPKKPKKEALKP